MKLVQTLFSLSIMAAAVSCGNAMANDDNAGEEGSYANKPAYTMVDFRNDMSRASDDFFGGSRTLLKFRTMYHNKRTTYRDPDTEQLGLGIEANFQSGWINDAFGFDLSAYTGQKLDLFGIDQNGSSGGMFIREYEKGKGNTYKNYGKIGQAYLKAKWRNPGIEGHGNFKVGRLMVYKGFMGGSNSRLTPLTWEGAVADYNLHGTEFYGAYATGISPKNSSGFDDFTGTYGDVSKVKYVYTYGVKRQPVKGFGFEAAVGEGQNYSRQWMGRANYTFDIVNGYEGYLDAQYYQIKSLDQQKTNDWKSTTHGDWNAYNRPFDLDKKAELMNLNVMLSKGDLSGWVAWQYTKAPRHDRYDNYGDGQFTNKMASNDYSTNYSWIGVPNYVGMFNYDGMKSHQLGVRYHLDRLGYPGWYTSFVHTYGSEANRLAYDRVNKKSVSFDGHAQENMLEVKYKFQSRALKGLDAKVVLINYKSNFQKFGSASKRQNHDDTNEIRFQMNYYFNVF